MSERFLLLETLILGKVEKEYIAEFKQTPECVYESIDDLRAIANMVKEVNNAFSTKNKFKYKLELVLLPENKIYEVKCNKVLKGKNMPEFTTVQEAKYWVENRIKHIKDKVVMQQKYDEEEDKEIERVFQPKEMK